MKFTAQIQQAGRTATGIEVPPEVVEGLGGGKRPKVSVTINGQTYRSSVAVMGGKFMVGVSAENRALTGVVVIIAILAFLSVIRFRAERRDLFVLTLLQGLSIPLQAVIGGITVLTGLNSYIVGLHFVVSILLVALTAMLVYRVYYGPGGGPRLMPAWYRMVAHVTSLFVAITVVVGILTTGSGPPAGGADTPRNGLDTDLLQHLHSWPAYATLGGTVLLVLGALTLPGASARTRRFALVLLAIEIVQIVVGISQARLGLPEILVGIHMVLAGALVGAMTTVVLTLRGKAPVRVAAREGRATASV
jgi:cytochrome c oxidase assembly protein subunit 15